MRYTPGQWTARPGDSVVFIDAADGRRVAATNTKSYYEMHDGTDIANARLIAAAPEMLDALKRCVEWHGKRSYESPEAPDLLLPVEEQDDPEIVAAMRAIAKAEGRQS